MTTGQNGEHSSVSQRTEPSIADAAERLWSFATAVYSNAAVARACLRVQDEHGLDVNLLLFAAWCAREGRSLGVAQLALAGRHCDAWRRDVILPLRRTRRRWKGASEREADYAAVKELEIAAERRQLALLGGLVDDPAFRVTADASDRTDGFRAAMTGDLLSRNLAAVAAEAGKDAAVLEDFESALCDVPADFQSAARKPPD